MQKSICNDSEKQVQPFMFWYKRNPAYPSIRLLIHFGYHSDDLHWKNIVADISSFRSDLYRVLNVSDVEFKAYREKIKTYRDKDVAHIEIRPVSNVPDMTMALKAVNFYYQKVLKELSGFGDYNNWPNDLNDFHQRSLEQAKTIVAIAYEATRSIAEKVY